MYLDNYLNELPIFFHIILVLSFLANISSTKDDNEMLELGSFGMPRNARVRFFSYLKIIWNTWFYRLFLIPCILTSIFLHWSFGIFLFIEAYFIPPLIHRIWFGLLNSLDRINNIYSRKMEFFLSDFRLYLILGDIYLIVEIIRIMNNAS